MEYIRGLAQPLRSTQISTLGAAGSHQLERDVVAADADDRFAADGHDPVADGETDFLRRAAADDRNHRDLPVDDVEIDPNPRIPLEILVPAVVLLLRVIGGVRIQIRDESADRAVDE
jgi:hypothetical protein